MKVLNWGLIGLSLVAMAVLLGLRFNVSPSLPYGLYLTHPVPSSLARGLLVVVDVPGVSRRFAPFMKPIVGLPGDRVCVPGWTSPGAICDGRYHEGVA